MRKRIVITIAIIVVVALAFGAGVLVQRQYQLARNRAARDFVGLDDPVPPAPQWDEWHYPNAEVKGSIKGPSMRLMGDLVQPAGRYAVFVTTDDFETVAKFYAEKAHFKNPDSVASSRSAVSSTGTFPDGASNHLLDDFKDPTDLHKSRRVATKCLIRRSRSYDVTVFITRADDETHTHILLLYDPKTEAGDAAQWNRNAA